MKQKGNIAPVVLLMVILAGAAVLLMRGQTFQQSSIQPLALLTKPKEISVHHPDGTMKLIMRTKRETDGTRTYSFFTANVDGSNEKLVFSKTFSPDQADITMTIPANTWTPAKGKYAFVEERSPSALTYVVFQTSGEPFNDKEQSLDVGALFNEKNKIYAFGTATGWASPTLLIFTTTNRSDGTRGPSYWFELPSRAFLQLAR